MVLILAAIAIGVSFYIYFKTDKSDGKPLGAPVVVEDRRTLEENCRVVKGKMVVHPYGCCPKGVMCIKGCDYELACVKDGVILYRYSGLNVSEATKSGSSEWIYDVWGDDSGEP